MLLIQNQAYSRRRRSGVSLVFFLFCIVSACALPCAGWAILYSPTPTDLSVQVSATIQESPPKITLSWPNDSLITSYTIYQKLLNASSWGTALTTIQPGQGTTSYSVSSGIVVGTAYEFEIVGNGSGSTAYGYLATGIDLPLVDNRGKVILMVEQTTGSQLTAGLNQLTSDLLGDGWTVIRHNVSATDKVEYVKSLVDEDYIADPTHVKALFLFGNVPIPQSGWLAPVPGEEGSSYFPFPTDLYYGIIGGTWTDVDSFGTGNESQTNLPHDGRFDQNTVMDPFLDSSPAQPVPAAPVALEVGRVDLSNLPTFDVNLTEVDLLSNYLSKDHNFRTASIYYNSQGLIDDNFTEFGDFLTEGFAQNGWRNFAPLCPPTSTNNYTSSVQGNYTGDSANFNFQVTDGYTPTPYLWAYGCGFGGYGTQDDDFFSSNTNTTIADMTTDDCAVFTMLFGGDFGEWNAADDLLRGELATPNFGLTCCWGGRPNWYFHRMGIGEEIGDSARLTQNNINGLYLPTDTYVSGSDSTTYNGNLYVNLMGDPTLRLTMEPPAGTLNARQSSDHTIQLTWNPPLINIYNNAQAPPAGYAIYRVTLPDGPVTRISGSGTGSTFVSGTSFSDSTPVSVVSGATSNSNTYMVRAVYLENRTSSSYYNGSEGTMVSITPLYNPPTTNPQSYDVGENSTLTVPASSGVLTGDTAAVPADTPNLTASLVSAPANGTLTLSPNGSFTYSPTTGFNGQDTFSYKASDGYAYSAATLVTITVHSVPTVKSANYSTTMNGVLTVATPGVLSNDSDLQGDTLTAVQVSGPAKGALTLNTNGSFTYTPLPFFTGEDSFIYQASNGYCTSASATVTILVDAQPVVVNESYATNENTKLTVTAANGVLSNASDINNYPLTAVEASGPTHGTLTLNTDGSFTYTPATGFSGSDSFTYQANDGFTNSTSATVTITVNPIPVALNHTYPLNAGAILKVAAPGVLANVSNANGATLTANPASQPAHGTLAWSPIGDGSFNYTPVAGFYGVDSFTYTASNSFGPSPPATVTLTVNAVPVAVNSSYTTDHDVALTVAAPGVLANDSDADNGPDPLIAVLSSNPAHGTLTWSPIEDGSFTYTPNAGYYGPDSFTYRASDGEAYSNVATVALTVYGTPTAGTGSYTITQNTVLQVSGPGLLSISNDPNGLALTVSKVSDVTHGTLVLNPNGSFTYTPVHNFISTNVWLSTNVSTGAPVCTGVQLDSFTYQVTDGVLTSAPSTVTITVNPTGYKGDVAPRPDGNGTVDLADWVQVGRFVVGLDQLNANNPSEALRAHCATASTAPLDITDWTAAANFAAGLAPLQPVSTTGVPAPLLTTRSAGRGVTRVSLGNLTLARGDQGTVPVVLTALGTEGALSFTLSYDPKRLRLTSVTPVGVAAGAQIQLNNAGASRGQTGVLLMRPLPATFPAGSATILRCTFSVLPDAPLGSTPLTFSNTVVARAVSDIHANHLADTMTNGSILITK